MNIVEIIPSMSPIGGAERLVLDLACNMSKNPDNKITVISLYSNKDDDVINELLSHKNVSIIFLEKKRGVDLTCAKRLKKEILSINPDIIHCHLDSLVTIYLSKIYRKYRIFYTFHTLINESVIGKKSKPKNILYKHIFKKKYVTPIAISEVIKSSICGYFNLKESSVMVAYNGVPVEKFANNVPLEKRKYDFVFAGRFIDSKNPKTIIRAFGEIKQKHPESKLVMIGQGPLLDECKKITEEKNIDGISFTGFVFDVYKYLKESKIMLLPSTYEGNPMIINEAIASKCYIIATNVGGIPDVVNDNCGKLIEYSDNLQTELVDTMRDCLDNIKNIETVINNEYKNNCSRVSIDNTISQYMNIFMEQSK